MNKRDVLTATTFGHRIAEEEADDLIAYFVETEQWRKVISGDADIVYGPKGSGKSALYALLRQSRDSLLGKRIVLAAGENVRGTPVFSDLIPDPPATEEQFRGLWKLYFLSLTGTALLIAKAEKMPSARDLLDVLSKEGLVQTEFSLKKLLRGALDYLRKIDSVSAGVKINPGTGLPEGAEGKITLYEPGLESRKEGYISADSLLSLADNVFAEIGLKFWIILDRLDVAFAESPELESNALRALFRVYLDLLNQKYIALKIFLRDDIWTRISAPGFREASHITRSITITWDSDSLLHLVIRRALHNEAIRKFYQIDSSIVLASATEQRKLFYRIFDIFQPAFFGEIALMFWLVIKGAKPPALNAASSQATAD